MPHPPALNLSPDLLPPRRHPALLAAALIFVILTSNLLAWLPVASNGFVNWDDPINILDNPDFRGLSPAHLKWMFTTGRAGVYQPLGWLAYAVQFHFADLSPRAFHLTSLALHLLNAFLVFILARKLLSLAALCNAERGTRNAERESSDFPLPTSHFRLPTSASTQLAAALAALLFSLHPLRAECVAWISGQPYLLASLFFLLASIAYLSYAAAAARAARTLFYALALLAFAASQLSKAIGISLPLVLLLLDLWPLRRLRQAVPPARLRRTALLLLEKIPFLAVSAFIAHQSIQTTAAVGPAPHETLLTRLLVALLGAAHYLYKTLVPVDLSPYYPRPTALPLASPIVLIAAGVLLLLAAAAILLAFRRRQALAAAFAAFLLIIAPVSGIVWHGEQLAADRYTYLACLPWAILIGGVFARAALFKGASPPASLVRESFLAPPLMGISSHAPSPPLGRRQRTVTIASILTLPLLSTLAALSTKQAALWNNSTALWSHALQIHPDSPTANINFGWAVTEKEPLRAIDYFNKALRLRPNDLVALNLLGEALTRLNRRDEALRAYEQALALNPNHEQTLYNLGTHFALSGQYNNAQKVYARLLELSPGHFSALFNLANALHHQNRPAEAIPYYRRALEINPSHLPARSNLAIALLQTNNPAAAILELEKVLTQNPNDPKAVQYLDQARAALQQNPKPP